MNDATEPSTHTTLARPIETDTERPTPKQFRDTFDLATVPTHPGCYLMHDTEGRILYVGKAKNLRARLRTYINDQDARYSVKFLMKRVAEVKFLVTENEKEAVLLENSLIKEHKPRYNIQLKDDKTYVSLRFNMQQEYPRITVVRRARQDGARYFGPYSSAHSVRETLRQVQRMFPLRTCTDHVLNNRARPCLYYQMKQCVAPCVGYTTPEEYRDIAEQAALALEGRDQELDRHLTRKIKEHAEALEFEKAAIVRDRLYALRRTLERQRAVAVAGAKDRDVFGVYHSGRYCEIQVLFYRGGKMLGGRSFSFKLGEMPFEEVFSSFLLQYYSETPFIPGEILVPLAAEDYGVLEEILGESRNGRVRILAPQRGEKLALIKMAERNARSSFEEKQLAEKAKADTLAQLKEKLGLRRVPQRMECFDISTFQGSKSVGSMVCFDGGAPNKSRYRRFSIKEVEGQDDFGSLREVLLRRFRRAIEEDDLPDLVVIDGGKGQLNVASAVFRDLGIEDLDHVGLAKSRPQGDGTATPERLFFPGRKNPIILPQKSAMILMLAQMRDEAHRFAITYHRKRRSHQTLQTALVGIPGVGPKRARTLLNALGSVARIREAPLDEIAAVPGISEALARTIKEALE